MSRKKIQKKNLKQIKIPKSHREIQAFAFKPTEINIQARQVANTLEVDISGEIGWEVDDVQINSALRTGDDYSDVLVRINSPGGNVWTGIAIYNRLTEVDQPVETRIMGEAASAASIIAMAGDEISMNQSASFLVHNPYVGIIGDASKLRVMAQALDEITDMMVDIYTERTGMSDQEIRDHMDADRSMKSAEAKKLGFVDRVIRSNKSAKSQVQSFDRREQLRKWLATKT